MSDEKIQGLPVAGYRPQTKEAIALVDVNKDAEERCLRILDSLAARPDIDPYWLKIGRAQIQVGFMAVNRAVFQPDRVTLPGDTPADASDATGNLPAGSVPAVDAEQAAPVIQPDTGAAPSA
ncbi:hypothetical protein MFUR16E_04540 [Methylobacterium fujisawaense]|uniref:Acb2/Tad1 domain-containing protein n=1 Tax=Methylobacterium fujisawaense TaxID=107400 RepID=UPI002F31DDE2